MTDNHDILAGQSDEIHNTSEPGTMSASGERIIIDGNTAELARDFLSNEMHRSLRTDLRNELQDIEGVSRDTPILRPAMSTGSEEDADWFTMREMQGEAFETDAYGKKLVNINTANLSDMPPSWRQYYENKAKLVVDMIADDVNNGIKLNGARKQELATSLFSRWQEIEDEADKTRELGEQDGLLAINILLQKFGLQEGPLDELRHGRTATFKPKKAWESSNATAEHNTGSGWGSVEKILGDREE